MDIAKSIKAINPTAEFKYSNEDSSTLEWLNGTTPISKSDIESKMAELQVEFDAEQIAKPLRLASAKTKLEGLGLTTEEVKEAFGI